MVARGSISEDRISVGGQDVGEGQVEDAAEPGLDVWVLVHPDLRRNPRLRLFRDMVVASLQRQRPRLEGRRAEADGPSS